MNSLELTYRDYIIRVAEFLGIAYYGDNGDEAAQKPTDAHDLDRCKRIVNDGWRAFVNSRANWNWLTPKFTITFQVNHYEYDMPPGFYGNIVEWPVYDDDQSGVRWLERSTPARLRELHAEAVTTAHPSICAFEPYQLATGQTRWRMLVWPRASRVETVSGRCRLYPNGLEEDSDVPNCGPLFSEAVLASIMSEAERDIDDTIGIHFQRFQVAMAKAVENDKQLAPRRLTRRYGGAARRSWYSGVDQYNDTEIAEPDYS